MTTVTVDTNVLASGLIGDPAVSPPAAVIDAWRARRFSLVLSEHILNELRRTLALPYFRRFLSADQAAAEISLLHRRARVVALTTMVSGIATHPEDDLVLSTALSAGADYLVTGDLPLLSRVPEYEGVRLLSPRSFLSMLTQAG